MLSFKNNFREPVSGPTHFVGLLLSISALVILVAYAAMQGTTRHIIAFAIFGTG
jgi:predicted membrane channel-forming protein YqfA (hemolysin III family)